MKVAKNKRCACPEHGTVSSATGGSDKNRADERLISMKSNELPMWVLGVLKVPLKRFDHHLCRGCLEYAVSDQGTSSHTLVQGSQT